MAQDSSLPDFWDRRYQEKVMPWDAGHVPAEFRVFARQLPAGERILVPGCGSGYEVGWLAGLGLDVLGLEFSPAACEQARQVLGPEAVRVQPGDFFRHEAPAYDGIYERALLCALPRKTWQDWARQMAALVRPGGWLAGYFFHADTPKGPPFGLVADELDALLAPAFVCETDEPSLTTLEIFAGRERWQVWRRCDNPSH